MVSRIAQLSRANLAETLAGRSAINKVNALFGQLPAVRNSWSFIAEKTSNVTLKQSYIRKVGFVGSASRHVCFHRADNLEAGKPDAFAKSTGAAEEGDRFKHPADPSANAAVQL